MRRKYNKIWAQEQVTNFKKKKSMHVSVKMARSVKLFD